MNPIQTIVVDDSAFMRKMISDILSSDNRINVIATARNGEDGIKKIKELQPDVVTLDVEMPIMDGITALQKIMETNPTSVVMFSSVTSEGTAKTIQAISYGAVDFISKPSGSITLNLTNIKEEIIAKVITASEVTLSKVVAAQPLLTSSVHTATISMPYDKTIVAIGTSTGGPRALQRVLTELPKDFRAPILIVQHMPAGFTKSLAERLNSLAKINVKEATHGEIIQDHTAYIAPGNYHMRTRKVGTTLAIELTEDSLRNGHRPSIDELFESLSIVQKVNKIAVILTGMGTDGSEGIKKLKASESKTIVIAESEQSSVVYGMPKAAVRTNYVNHIVHLHQVGETITNLVHKNTGGK
ncbi:chemotaxis response regulator protein-glutamate methylesterase [Virgibacillus byunsanensis]|uniref:Protein-glutamate methylesterase/protein-glutamine glutaminase n=1 Tax=Virgibacillus byunsanensis TaxID=570945 RepID=A0ABW3LHZ2_9BACI